MKQKKAWIGNKNRIRSNFILLSFYLGYFSYLLFLFLYHFSLGFFPHLPPLPCGISPLGAEREIERRREGEERERERSRGVLRITMPNQNQRERPPEIRKTYRFSEFLEALKIPTQKEAGSKKFQKKITFLTCFDHF